MTKEQVEDIIKDLENSGYEVNYKTYTNNSVSFYCNEHVFSINYKDAKPVVDANICLDYHTSFDQNDVDWLNSITGRWEIYKHRISFFTAKSEHELENILLYCVECF